MIRILSILIVLASAVPLAGCVVVGPGYPGWCAYHPYRCR